MEGQKSLYDGYKEYPPCALSEAAKAALDVFPSMGEKQILLTREATKKWSSPSGTGEY